MAVLIHLNGPPGIGKSTLAARWVADHPGSLNLDIDTLHRLIGGWREPDTRTHDVLRPIALAMAGAQLATGRDVVLPQYLATTAEIEAFAEVADDQGARFCEVVLLDTREHSLTRFEQRPDDGPWARHNRDLVAVQGGPAFLTTMYDRLLQLLPERPRAVVLTSAYGDVEATYADLLSALPGGGAG